MRSDSKKMFISCYGLNCVPTKFACRNPNSQYDGVWNWGGN